jgi:hypothetical protein
MGVHDLTINGLGRGQKATYPKQKTLPRIWPRQGWHRSLATEIPSSIRAIIPGWAR